MLEMWHFPDSRVCGMSKTSGFAYTEDVKMCVRFRLVNGYYAQKSKSEVDCKGKDMKRLLKINKNRRIGKHYVQFFNLHDQ